MFRKLRRLSSAALEALNSFLIEKDERQKRFEDLKATLEKEYEERQRIITMEDFEEDWQQSQVGERAKTRGLRGEGGGGESVFLSSSVLPRNLPWHCTSVNEIVSEIVP